MMSAIEIKIWMLKNELTSREIAKRYKVSEQFVGQFLRRQKTSKGLTDFFIKEGCPGENFKNGKVAA